MQEFPTKVDGVSTEPAAEYNNLTSELKTNLSSLGIVFDSLKTNQLAEAIETYALIGQHFSDGGAANTYVLSAVPGTRINTTSYRTGLTVNFFPANTNTGASTVDVATLGPQAILMSDGVTPLVGGELVVNVRVEMQYDGTNFRLNPSGVPDATTTIKGIASFNAANFVVTAGAVSLVAGVGPPDFNSGFISLAASTNSTQAHGLGQVPDRFIFVIRGDTGAGAPPGGNPTVAFPNFPDTNGNGISFNADATNFFIRWVNWAALVFQTTGALRQIDVNVEFKILAWV